MTSDWHSLLLGLSLPAAAFGSSTVLAEGEQDLAKQSQNPVGDVVSLPFENNILVGIGPSDSSAYVLNLKPIYPVRIGKVNLINRLILPVIYAQAQHVTLTERGRQRGRRYHPCLLPVHDLCADRRGDRAHCARSRDRWSGPNRPVARRRRELSARLRLCLRTPSPALVVKQELKMHLPAPGVPGAGAPVFNLLRDPREENPLVGTALWSGASFQDMVKRHQLMIARYPHLPLGKRVP
jgi:hypothetical protein